MDNKSDVIDSYLDRLSSFQAMNFPVISLYLNLQPGQTGRDNAQPFVRKELRMRAKIFAPRSAERTCFERDITRIQNYLENEVVPQSNSAAIFACFGQDEFFEAIQLAAPMDQNSLHIGRQPHLYPLAKISSQYRRYACLIADTHAARIYVFGTGKRLGQEDIVNEKTHRVQMGGWSQARYQRHVDHYRLHHVKEVIETLSKIVKAEGIPQVFISGDEVIIPKIREQLTPELKALVVDELKLPMNTPEKTILEATLKAAREQDGEEKKIKQLLDQYRSGALGVAGARATLQALDAGQVNELVICADPNAVINDLQPDEAEIIASGTPVTDPITTDSFNSRIAEALVLRARQTGAEITFIENPELLSGLGGTGAFLRYRI